VIIIKFLIIGATGFLGNKLINIFKENHEVIGTYNKTKNEQYEFLDISDKKAVKLLIEKTTPDIIINTSHIPNANTEEMKELAEKINSNGPKNLADVCNTYYEETGDIDTKNKITLIHMSTDFIFDGEKGNYTEEDLPNPISHYGKTKLKGEQGVIKYQNHIILRVSTLYGYNKPTDKKFTNWIINSLKDGKEIKIINDQFTCPTLINDIGKAILKLLELNKIGIYNCVGSEKISRYKFAVKVAEIFGLNKTLIKSISMNDLKQNIIRPKNTTLDISKLKSEEIQMSNINEGLTTMKNEMGVV
jgi:dTDP-4-dehydrorhamnose reductase